MSSVKTAGVGHFQIPTAPAALMAVAQSASAHTLGAAVSFGNAPSTLYITGVNIGVATAQIPTYVQIQILVAASIVSSVLVPYGVSSGVAASVLTGYRAIFPPIPVTSAAAITVKSASSVASAVAWGVSLECIAQTNVVDDAIAVTTVTTVTNQLTAAAIATGVWQDATAGDFTVASSIGKALQITNIAPGAAGGHMISGANAGTTTLGALTVTGVTTHTGATVYTGNVSMAAGLNITQSSANTSALVVTGNGTGDGAIITSGSGITGHGVEIVAASTNGSGLKLIKTGTGLALSGATTDLILAKTTNITGLNDIAATAIVSAGAITTSAGAVSSVTSVSGSVGSVTGAVGSVTGLTAANLDVAVSSRLATAGYTIPPTTAENADKLLGRSIAGAADGGRTVQDALKANRNKVAIVAGTMTVYEADDTAVAWTAAVTTAAGNPIDSIDPA